VQPCRRNNFSRLRYVFQFSTPLWPRSCSAIKKPLLECTITLFHTSTRHYSKRNKMPPKKQVVEEKILLGRPGNNLKSGIVGCLAGP